jgi:signal transduction histidine kinase
MLQLFRSGDISAEELVLMADQMSLQLDGTSAMMDSLLVWAANQLGGLTLKPVDINLARKIDKVIAALSVVAERKKIRMIHDRQEMPPVTGDADQVRIILQNLISNAIKYTRTNGTVSITYLVDEQVHLFIKDDGIGMSPEDLEEILNSKGPHVSTYGTANEKGVGLGMQLVRSFAAQNNIVLNAESKVGEGTTFKLTFKFNS